MAPKAYVISNATSDFLNEILQSGSKVFPKEELERLKMCMQCGKCVGSCPSGRIAPWRIRKTFRETQLGLRKTVLSDDNLWACTTCYTCQERCPRGVHTTDIVRIIRNLAVKYGYIKNTHRRICEIFLKHGHAVPVNDQMRKVRRDLGLSEVPPTVHSHPESLTAVLRLVEETGFKKMMERTAK